MSDAPFVKSDSLNKSHQILELLVGFVIRENSNADWSRLD